MSNGNGHHPVPVKILDRRISAPGEPPPEFFELPPMPVPRPRATGALALLLFLLTVISTLTVGTEFALAYSHHRAPFSSDFFFYGEIARQPSLLLLGIPFSFTLLSILLAHELGHFFACRYYGISASFPYFIPADRKSVV